MPAAHLKKIRHRASEITKKHPGTSYQSALKKAGKEYREGKIGKIGKVRRSAKTIGAVADETLSQSLARTRKKLTEELGWLMATQRTARTQKEKRKLQPRISGLAYKLRALR